MAYDGSAKANEALFIAAYLTLRWQKSLTVLTVKTSYTDNAIINQARDYLQQQGLTEAKYILCDGPINEAILKTAEDYNINLLIMLNL